MTKAINGSYNPATGSIAKPRDIEAPIGHAAAVEAALLAPSTIVRTMKDRIKLANIAASRANDKADLERFFTEEEPAP